MKPCIVAAIVITFVFSLLTPDPAAAKSTKGQKAKPTPVPAKVDASGAKIESVSGDTIKIKYSKTSTTYKVSGETLITVDERRVRSTELKPGMHAEVTASTLRPNLLLTISARSIPKS